MKVISEKHLSSELRKMGDCAKKRLWIASPFIGNPRIVRKILGNKWQKNPAIDVRLLTDISNAFIDRETIKLFLDQYKIRTIKGLHAKIYIVDNSSIITSANLTAAGFSKRYEAGALLSSKDIVALVKLYEKWWGKVAKEIPLDWERIIIKNTARNKKSDYHGDGLKTRFPLPPDPGNPISAKFNDYKSFLKDYKLFADDYKRIQRLWPKMELYFETDMFLDYLFHHAKGKPSKRFRGKKPKTLTAVARKKEMRKHALLFKKWVMKPDGTYDIHQHQKSSKAIKRLLSKKSIGKIKKADIDKVANMLNCLSSMPLARVKFLNPKNNGIRNISRAWKDLLHGKDLLQSRMSKCNEDLPFFGRSSIHELLGYFSPGCYPLRNTNSNAGLRFFGYNVSSY